MAGWAGRGNCMLPHSSRLALDPISHCQIEMQETTNLSFCFILENASLFANC